MKRLLFIAFIILVSCKKDDDQVLPKSRYHNPVIVFALWGNVSTPQTVELSFVIKDTTQTTTIGTWSKTVTYNNNLTYANREYHYLDIPGIPESGKFYQCSSIKRPNTLKTSCYSITEMTIYNLSFLPIRTDVDVIGDCGSAIP